MSAVGAGTASGGRSVVDAGAPGAAPAPDGGTLDLAVQVVRGHPDDEELVALVAALSVLSRRAASAEAEAATAGAGAASPWRSGAALRERLDRGPDAWRAAVR